MLHCIVVVNILNFNVVVSEIKLQSLYNIHFLTNTLGKGIYPFIPQALG